jgi:hypothetical protein
MVLETAKQKNKETILKRRYMICILSVRLWPFGDIQFKKALSLFFTT